MKKNISLFVLIFCSCCKLMAQDDLLLVLQNDVKKNEPVIAMFKGNKLINIQTNETVRKHNLDFRVGHLFGNVGTQSGGGVHNLYGIDQSADIRIAFHYGITDRLMVGVSRVKRDENLEGLLKYRVIDQTTDNKIPVAVSLFANVTWSAKEDPEFITADFRFIYCSELIVARKISRRLSVLFSPVFLHRNFVAGDDENNTISLCGGFRYKFTPSASIIADYSHTLGRKSLLIPRYDVIGAGVEIETGGHVFTLMFTNASGILEDDFLVNTFDSWTKGGMKLSFNISRMFHLSKDENGK